ncbi:ATP-dependent zinc protease [Luteolibacter arcticus]|uniref:ATP-dependent zinc protease n=1 Tax=Luteolibacter arcticus TaxID=1581411 RepID=A0ABT3GBJ8_9BACT|nr:ATP-dependent zinc protease [Luteolibacter arcticus]MCW1920999.1 ATP-dependent zinc protease [Luteolibacter arcticus]
MPVGLFAAPETAKPVAPEKAAEAPAKGKEEAPVKPATGKDKEATPPAKPAPSPAKPANSKEVTPPAKPANGKETVPTTPTEPKETVPATEMPATKEGVPTPPPAAEDDEAAAERKEADAGTAVARPVSSDPVQVYGWREWVLVGQTQMKLAAKLDTGALTSSIHAEEKELFERDGKKWVRFIVTDPGEKNSPRTRIEAPLVRIAHIKDPGGKSEAREVVRLNFTLGERKLRADFTLNNRSNMLSPVLIGRTTIKELGWVDPSRAYLADQKILR